MTRGLCWLLLLALASPSPVAAGDWMFQRSYYSHYDSPGFSGGPVPEPRSAYRAAFVGGNPRFAIRGGYRINSMVLWNGSSTDRVYYRENWFDVGP